MMTGHETGHSFDVNNNCFAPLLLVRKQRTEQIKMQKMLKNKSVFNKQH